MGLVLALVFIVPVGVIFAVTNQEVTLNVLAEFIGGVLFPGNALAMNMCVVLSSLCRWIVFNWGAGSSRMDM